VAGSGGGRHLLEDGRQRDADSAADRIDSRAGGGAQPCAAAVLFDVDRAEIGEIVDASLPFEPAAACRQTIDQFLAQDEGKEGAEDGAADAGISLVEDRAGWR
jgi:hypothetical protein